MEDNLLLSICIPTNGVCEWVFPVLDSIYFGVPDMSAFEVIITDNGDNSEFKNKMTGYVELYNNLVYKETDAVQFLNQIEAFKLAKGTLIKFVNHRQCFRDGALEYLIKFVKEYEDTKPSVYFMNGAQKNKHHLEKYDDFNAYVNSLGIMSSWSAGTAMWKEDFNRMDLCKPFNKLFPHTDMVFFDKNKICYMIDHEYLFDEIEVDDTKKGKYNLFSAFAIEYIYIIIDLLRDGFINKETYLKVKSENAEFLAQLYYKYIIRKQPCSYDLSGVDEALDIFYSKREIKKTMYKVIKKAILKK